jgi:hypothetical protein
MLNHMLTETLVRDRQRELARSAVRPRRSRSPRIRSAQPAPIRTRAGWLLIRAGLRLTRAQTPSLDGRSPPLVRVG